ncbi:MAG TPA: hypothetical protein DIT07_14390 [Sphingobacteriaceae bacterium]|nr:hypothetical protein [Sphingobacteriaceae bacterium]
MTDKHLIQIGRITINFQSLEHIICWAIVLYSKDKKELKIENVFESKLSFSHLLNRLERQCTESNEIKALILEIKAIAEKRNQIIHSSWWTDTKNRNEISRNKGKKTTIVEIRDLKKIADEILALKNKLSSFLGEI